MRTLGHAVIQFTTCLRHSALNSPSYLPGSIPAHIRPVRFSIRQKDVLALPVMLFTLLASQNLDLLSLLASS